MARIGESADLLKCSFCGKSQKQVQQLIAGPGVYICDECVELCNEIIEERLAEAGEETSSEFELGPKSYPQTRSKIVARSSTWRSGMSSSTSSAA